MADRSNNKLNKPNLQSLWNFKSNFGFSIASIVGFGFFFLNNFNINMINPWLNWSVMVAKYSLIK